MEENMEGKLKVKYGMFVLLILISLSFVSAIEFDNVKSYNSSKKEITITNIFGMGSELAKITLINYTGYCFPGECYAYYELDNLVDNILTLEDTKYYSKTKELLSYKVTSYEIWDEKASYEIPIYKKVCKDEINVTTGKEENVCFWEEDSKEKKYGKWVIFNPTDKIKKGVYFLRQKVDVNEGETVDIIPKFYGLWIEEWIDFVGYTKYEYYETGADNWAGMTSTGGNPYQTFTIGTTGTNETFTLRGVGLYLSCDTNRVVELNVTIWNASTSTTKDANALIVSEMFNWDCVGGEYAFYWNNFSFSVTPNEKMGAGKQYYMSLRINISTVSAVGWSQDRSSPTYAGGQASYDAYSDQNWDSLFQVWGSVEAGDTTYPIFSDYWDDNATLLDTGTGHFNVTVTSTNGTVILHINGTDILATNLTANVYNASHTFTSTGNYLYNWTAYGNGTSHLLNTSVNMYYWVNASSDTPPPKINITYPLNISYNLNISALNYTYSDVSPDSCWYSKDAGATNSTRVASGTNFTSISSIEGSNTWTLYCNDTSNNKNSTSVTFFKDTINPSINITYPLNTTYNINVNGLNYSYNDIHPDSCWYSTNGGAINSSKVSAGTNFTSVTSSDGSNTWIVYCNDSANNINSSSITFFRDILSPTISLQSPANNLYSNNTTQNFTALLTDAGVGLKNTTLHLYNSTGLHSLITTSISGDASSFNIGTEISSLTDDVYKWTYDANDNLNNYVIANNFTLTIDTTSPTISFGTGTLASEVNVSQSNVYINTTWIETNLANITFYIYNSSWSNATTYTTATYSLNLTNMANGYYWYYVNITDKVNQRATTGIRKILLDTGTPTNQSGYTSPSGTYIPGVNNTFTSNATTNFTANITDIYGIKNITITVQNETGGEINKTTTSFFGNILSAIIGVPLTLIDGVYHFFVEVYDIAGNYVVGPILTLFVDTTPPTFASQNYTMVWNDNNSFVYTLNATINELNQNQTGINFGGVNYSVYNLTNTFYKYNFTKNLTYVPYTSSYYWWAIDNASNYNQSENYYFNISCPVGHKTFNNSLCMEDLVFTGNQNITRYLSIPNSISALISAYLNLSGYVSITDLAKKENSFSRYSNGDFVIIEQAYDDNWDSMAIFNTLGSYLIENFTINYLGDSNTQWKTRQARGDCGWLGSGSVTRENSCYNFTSHIYIPLTLYNGSFSYSDNCTGYYLIPNDCISNNNLSVRTNFTDNTEGAVLGFFESSILYTGSYLNNVSLSISNFNVWNYSGQFNKTNNRTSNLASTINKYLNATYLVGTNYIIPFIFHSYTAGILRYLDLSYDNLGFIENSQTFNTSTYETSTENFAINLTYDSSVYSATGNLIYNTVPYVGTQIGTGNNIQFSRTIDIPSGSYGNQSLYWTIALTNVTGIYYYNSTFKNQTVKNANFTICGGTGGTTPFLNFSFKDESDNSVLNASNDLTSITYWLGSGTTYKTYTFQNTTVNYYYTFCALPNKSFIVDLSFKYSNPSYPLRTFTYDNQALTNTTTQKTLYLLKSTEGIYSAIRVADTSGSPISGVTIQYERQIAGIWTLLGQEVTGDDGIVTFWVNPNYQYRFTATKTGYATAQVIIQPSQTTYTITMSTTTGGGGFISDINGIKWEVYPGSGSLTATTNQNFNATITAALSNLENCKFELINANNVSETLGTTTSITNSSYCFLSITYTTTKDQKIFGRLSIDTTNTTGFIIVDADSAWIVFDFTGRKPWNYITSLFSDIKDLSEMGEGTEAEFNRIVLFFLVTTILIGVFIFFSGIELSNPGLSIVIIWCIILIASIGGFLTYNSGSLAYGTSNALPAQKYGLFFLFTLFGAGYFLSLIRRTGE